jgi:hypothetical protein
MCKGETINEPTDNPGRRRNFVWVPPRVIGGRELTERLPPITQ